MAQFVHPFLTPIGYRRDGRPIYPIRGGSEPPAEPPADPAAVDAPPAPAPADKGFPENTPVAEMTIDQQAAYWRHQSRKHEDRVKAYGGLTPDQIAELRQKAERHDALEFELMSDKDKSIAEAAQQARWAAEAEYAPRLVSAEFRAATAGRIDPEKLPTILEPLDLSKFLTDDGDVDTAKVAAFVDGIAPAKGTEPPPRRGPSPDGHGRRDSSATPGQSVASGRELYLSRKRQTTSS